MKLLVTGSSGFIASAFCEKAKNEHEIMPYDLPDYNILDVGTLSNKISNVDVILHFAAKADIVECFNNLDETFEVNIVGTYNIAKLCAELGKRLVFISTCCVYGNSTDKIEKETTTRPNASEPYACSKVAGEYIIKGMPNLDYIMLRIGTVYGVKQRDALFTQICLNKIYKEETIFIDGDGRQDRQLIYIDDLIDGIYKSLSLQTKNIIINLCGVEHISALDTMHVAEQVINKQAIYKHREQRYGQTFHENISIERARTFLGWEPKMKFFDGMKYIFENDERFK